MSPLNSKPEKNRKRSRPHIFAALGFLLAVLVIAFTLAVFTAFDSVTSRLSAGSLDIRLIEEKYDATPASERDRIMPRKLTAKDPKIKNTDSTDAFVFLEISVPTALVTEAEEDGTRKGQRYQELFYLKTNNSVSDTSTSFNTTPQSAEDNGYWVELPSFESGTDCRGDARTYVFGYSVYLEPGESTETLFDYVMFKNLVRSDNAEGKVLGIRVEACGIQADNLPDTLKDSLSGKLRQNEETLSRIYSLVKRQ